MMLLANYVMRKSVLKIHTALYNMYQIQNALWHFHIRGQMKFHVVNPSLYE